MPISYTVGTNRILVTGYALVAPCNFTDVYNADKAGTLSLHARVGIVGVDGGAVAVDRAERPTDYMVLGGASNDLYITVANWNLMTNATINVVGTDRDGAAQNENIVVVGNGNYSTTMWFATITTTQVTVFNTPGGGSFDYDLIQGQWGVVWKLGDNQFMLDAFLTVGVGGTDSWFADEDKSVLFSKFTTANNQVCLTVSADAEVRLGRVVDAINKTTSGGCMLMCLSDFSIALIRQWAGSQGLYIYSSILYGLGANYINAVIFAQDAYRLWNSTLSNTRIGETVGGDHYRVNVQEPRIGALSGITGGTYDDIVVSDGTGAPTNAFIFSNAPATVVAMQAYNFTRGMLHQTASGARYVINSTLNSWDMWWRANIDGPVYRQYYFDMRVVDATGAGIVGATVNMDDQFGANVFNAATGAGGDIAQQTVTYKTYDRVAAAAGVTDTEVTFSPHTVTISKAGYTTRTIVYTMDRQREEIEKLGLAGPHGLEYRRRRLPGEVSAMGGQGIG